MTFLEGVLLVLGGAFAGIVNVNAGGGSLLTVPLLQMAGVPGTEANGTNRLGILSGNISAIAQFRALGASGVRRAVPYLVPIMAGAAVGAYAISQVEDETFERIFGVLMIPLLLLSLRKSALMPNTDDAGTPRSSWPMPLIAVVFFGIGVYGGAIQAGVGIMLLLALVYSGHDLVTANSMKVVIILVQTLVVIPIFIANDDVRWLPGLVLAIGLAIGGATGARVAVAGGERIIRPILIVAVVGVAGRMLGLY